MEDDIEAFIDFYERRFCERRGRSPATATVTQMRRQIYAAMSASGCTTVSDLIALVADEDLRVCLWSLRKRSMTPGAQRTACYALRDFGDFAIACGAAERNVFRSLPEPSRNPAAWPSVWSDEELDIILTSASLVDDTRWHGLLVFLSDTGRRIGETLGIRWADLRVRDTHPNVFLQHTKRGVPQYVPLGQRVVQDVLTTEHELEWRAARWLTTSQRGNGGYHRDPNVFVFPWASDKSPRARLERLRDAERIPYRSFHEFRRTRITRWLADGTPIDAVSALVGHASIQTTYRYYSANSAMTFWRYVK